MRVLRRVIHAVPPLHRLARRIRRAILPGEPTAVGLPNESATIGLPNEPATIGWGRNASTPWDHAKAQAYEAFHNTLPLELAQQYAERVRMQMPFPFLLEEFFPAPGAWDHFKAQIAGKLVLDVGCGAIPLSAFLPWLGGASPLTALPFYTKRGIRAVRRRHYVPASNADPTRPKRDAFVPAK